MPVRRLAIGALALEILVAGSPSRANPHERDSGQKPADREPDETGRTWALTAGAGTAELVTSPGTRIAVARGDVYVRPWDPHGIAAFVQYGTNHMLGLEAGAETTLILVGVAYSRGIPLTASRRSAADVTLDLALGPSIGVLDRDWSEGMCLDFFGDNGCPSSRPDDFRSYETAVVAASASVAPNLHFGPVVLGPYLDGTLGASSEGMLIVGGAGVRLGVSL